MIRAALVGLGLVAAGAPLIVAALLLVAQHPEPLDIDGENEL